MKKIKIASVFLLLIFLMVSCSKMGQADDIVEELKGNGPVVRGTERYLDRIVLTWETVGGSSRYEVRYAQDSDMSDATVLPNGAVSLAVDGLDADQTYYWQVRAEVRGTWTNWSAVTRASTASFEASVAAYNILGAQHDPNIEPEFAWHLRKEAFRDIVLQADNNPDILSLQEANAQIDDVIGLLGEHYDYHVSPRTISPKAVLWKPDRFELVSFDDDIDIFGSSVSGYASQRYATQVRLRERNTGKELLVYNLHIPEGGNRERQEIRGIATRNVAAHAKSQVSQSKLPVIVLGDLNNYPETVIDGLPSAPMVLKNNGFQDTFDIALEQINGNYGTSVNRATSTARIGENGSMRIDYVFAYPLDQVAVTQYATIINFAGSSSTQLERPVPSDHHPVRAVLHLAY